MDRTTIALVCAGGALAVEAAINALADEVDDQRERADKAEAEVERLRGALEEIVALADLFSSRGYGCAYCGVGLEHRSWCPVTVARAALEPKP